MKWFKYIPSTLYIQYWWVFRCELEIGQEMEEVEEVHKASDIEQDEIIILTRN